MTPRRWTTLILVVLFEAWMYDRYAALGAQFHFWLHGLFGAALGLAALTLFRLARRRLDGRVAPWEAGWAGHLYSAVPDFLFLLFGVLHMFWMDVFALHISLHFVPRPLLTMWALFSVILLGYGLAMTDRRPAALSTLTVAARRSRPRPRVCLGGTRHGRGAPHARRLRLVVSRHRARMSARQWWRVTTTALVVAAASIGLTGTALAHPALLGSRPAAGAELVASPSQLSVTFSEPVDVSGDSLVVRGPQGLVELAGDAVEVDGDRTVVARPAGALPAGSYTFGWTVTASDGDVLTGTVPFTLSTAAAATPARPPPYAPVGRGEATGGSTAGAATGAALRWLLFLGLSLALGGVVGARLVAGVPGFGASQPPLAFGGGLVAVAATGSALHTLGAGDPVAGLLSLPTTGLAGVGAASAVQIGGGLLAVVLAVCRCRRWLVVAPLLFVIAAEAVRSHLESASGWSGAVLLAVHLGAAAVWAGALLFVLSAGWAQRRLPRPVLVRYAALSAGLFATVLVTGTVAALLLVDDVQALVTTAYGRTLLVKLTLVAVVAGLALAGRAAVRRSASAQSSRSGRLARVEAGALVGVLAVTALLISLSPPRADGPPAAPTVARQAP